MSALDLVAGPIEARPADLAVVALFSDERPLRGAAGRLDWRLCGRLSHLCAADRVHGTPGEALLIPGGGGVRAPRVLWLGLGAREELDTLRWSAWVSDALTRAQGLLACRVVLAVPAAGDALSERLDALAGALAAAQGDFELSLAAEPEESAAIAEWLRSAVRRLRRTGLEVLNAGVPHGASRAAPAPDLSQSSRAPAGRFTR